MLLLFFFSGVSVQQDANQFSDQEWYQWFLTFVFVIILTRICPSALSRPGFACTNGNKLRFPCESSTAATIVQAGSTKKLPRHRFKIPCRPTALPAALSATTSPSAATTSLSYACGETTAVSATYLAATNSSTENPTAATATITALNCSSPNGVYNRQEIFKYNGVYACVGEGRSYHLNPPYHNTLQTHLFSGSVESEPVATSLMNNFTQQNYR